jgi:hypothetical protein
VTIFIGLVGAGSKLYGGFAISEFIEGVIIGGWIAYTGTTLVRRVSSDT